ncbi:Hpt domain-containing protein [Halioxenophilus sp. WMMB6]|uniref:Hpt domain-containing protein n=1 Tax=Halioxenophilus sp. WMMB6 TaxID=3073815 RepID=UPI00295ED7ED|nr:Hpt domain-containing protein [Halioxenophilus sp. WMMB6]
MSEQCSAQGELPLPDLPGFDFAEAVLRLNGNQKLLLRLVNNFCDLYEQSGERFIELQSKHAFDELAELAHQIKGSGANLGAQQIASAAAAIESAVKQSELANIDRLIQHFIAVNSCLPQLREALQSPANAIAQTTHSQCVEPLTEISREQVSALLAAIKASLNIDYTACEKRIADLQRLCVNSRYAPLAERVVSCFAEFEYDELLVAVDNFLAE